MNFLIIIDTLNFGGAEQQVVMDANMLVQQGHQVILAFFHPGPLEKDLDASVRRVHLEGKSYLSRISGIKRIITNRKTELVFAHMYRAEIATAFAGIGSGIPVIFNEHGLGTWKKYRHRLVHRFASLFASEIWCASDFCRKLRITRDRFNANKLRTVYNFVDSERESVSCTLRDDILTELGKDKNTPVIGFVGRFDPVKRLGIIVDAASQKDLNNAIFVLVGDGMDRKVLETAIDEKGIKDRFYFTGYVNNPGGYYCAFDIFVLPSKRESLSVALLEAGRTGLPSVVFNVGGNAEIVQDGVTGYVVADDDTGSFINAIKKLIDTPDLRRKMGDAAAQKIINKFSAQNRMDEFLKVARRYA